MHEEFPAVYQLPIYSPGEQPVYFSETATAIELQAHLDIAKSKLMAWFGYYAMYSDGHHLLYQQFPEKYVFMKKQKFGKKENKVLRLEECIIAIHCKEKGFICDYF